MKAILLLSLILALNACVGDAVSAAGDTAGGVVSGAGHVAGALIP